MANRRNYGGGGGGGAYGGGYNQSNRNFGGLGGPGLSGVNPWQSGNSPGRNMPGTSSLLATSQLLNQLASSDSQLALATKLLSSILPAQQSQQPPSLMSIGNSFNMRYGGGFGPDRFRRDDRRNDNFRNRRQANDRTKDRKSNDNKARSDKPKTKPIKDEAKEKIKEDGAQEESDRDSERKDVEKTDSAEKMEKSEEGKELKEEGPLPEYEGIPSKLFHCHVCSKSMWNDVSFDTHVKGRNHRNKLRDLEENYQVQTDLMRQIAAVSLKLEEMRRGGKHRPYPDQYCKMCDLRFNGMTMFAHRSTNEHQSLKRFIHPCCDLCKVDFQVRIEYDEHVLTPAHLQQEAKAALRKEKFDKDPKYVELRENEAKVTTLTVEASGVGEKGDAVLNDEDRALITSLSGDGDSIPDYDPDAEELVARHMVTPQNGFYCKVCRLFLFSEPVVDTHCRTVKHYNSYMAMLKAEASKRQKETENAEKRKSGTSEDIAAVLKRRKRESINLNGDEKYDPEETMDEAMEADTKGKEDEMEEGGAMETQADEEKKVPQTPRRGSRLRAAKK